MPACSVSGPIGCLLARVAASLVLVASLASPPAAAAATALPPPVPAASSSGPCDGEYPMLDEPPEPTSGPLQPEPVLAGPVKLAVYVEAGLLAPLRSAIDRYTADLRAEGYDPAVVGFTGTAAQLRADLRSRRASGLQGALFVGDLPVYEFTSDVGGPSYPHDLYFMDLDGSYAHSSPTDVHVDGTGDVEPEIYVSRLTASAVAAMTGESEVAILQRYFDRNHVYRTGAVGYPHQGVVFADADWSEADWLDTLRLVYPSAVGVLDPAATTPAAYRDALDLDVETFVAATHADPTEQAFYRYPDYGGFEGWVTSRDVLASQPRAGFFNLFACSAARFTSPEFLLGTYVLATDRGLQGISSTKPGGICRKDNDEYYGPMGQGASAGAAFFHWFQTHTGSTDNPDEAGLVVWLYGMTMQGDPTLAPGRMGEGHTDEVVLVTGNARLLPAADRALVSQLAAAGRQVTLVDDDVLGGTEARSRLATTDVVVVSSSVNPALGAFATVLGPLARPIVLLEPYLARALGLTVPGAAGEVTGQTSTRVSALGAPSVGLTPGTYTVTSAPTAFGWYRPVPAATVVATQPGTAKAEIFEVERGRALTTGPAPARRVGFFFTYPTPPLANATGRQLFVAVVAWAAGAR